MLGRRLLAILPAAVLVGLGLWIGPRYDRYVLPAFDGYVYDAMADNPAIFTLAPWGYRVLEPWLVHFLPFPSAAEGYYRLNLVVLAAAVAVLGLWLKRLGYAAGPAALGSLAFALSPPVMECLRYQVLVAPLGILVVILIFLELCSPRLLVLAALFAAGALTREECLLPLPIVALVLSRDDAWKTALKKTAIVAGPALFLAVALRGSWGTASPAAAAFVVEALPSRIVQSASFVSSVLLSGVGVLALIGVRRERSVELRVLGLAMWALTFLAVFSNPYDFSSVDLPRLSAFAWPGALPLALAGLGFRRDGVPWQVRRSSGPVKLAAIAALVTAGALVALTDSYRRVPTDSHANPVVALARSRESIKTARTLDEGRPFVFDAYEGRYASAIEQPFNLTEGRRQRWFLYGGFGPNAEFGGGAPRFQGDAQLLLPVLDPRDAWMSVDFEGKQETQVQVNVAGLAIGAVRVNGRGSKVTVPRSALFRGDNVVTLHASDGASLKLVHWEVYLEPRGPPRR